MTTAEEARRRTLNAIKETYKDQLDLVDAIICRACDKLECNAIVTFESYEDRDMVKYYLDTLGYKTWRNGLVLTISWQSEKSNAK
jgi:predicted nucleic acid-binding protein